MSKHQEALFIIRKTQAYFIDYDKLMSSSIEEFREKECNDLQELVDIYPEYLELKAKNTPKKPIKDSFDRFDERCPNCKLKTYIELEDGSYYYFNYCQECGQEIDWSK